MDLEIKKLGPKTKPKISPSGRNDKLGINQRFPSIVIPLRPLKNVGFRSSMCGSRQPTVTLIVFVATFPAASFAIAVIACMPFARLPVYHE